MSTSHNISPLPPKLPFLAINTGVDSTGRKRLFVRERV
jgi:hypothetical protein